MRRFIGLAVFLGAAVYCASGAAQQSAEAPSVTVTPLTEALHFLRGRGGNVVASVGDDGILLIDDDYAQYAPAYQEALTGLA
ncbi:MAG: MBL fold metallo-hydrolase, partial [Halieaceae bacterium]|nr:MBL fold metallo-hydrolase [Halieaceae bacterium]